MPFFKFNHIKISAISAAIPPETVNVDSFIPSFGEEVVSKFKKITGVNQFRRTSFHQTASDLCYAAAENIIKSKGIDRTSINALVFIAHSSDYRRPATAAVLHKRLGLNKDCAAFDVALGCSAFVYGLQIVASLMSNSNIDKALLLVGETLTKMTNSKDKSVAMLFGDAGAAILLEKTNENIGMNGLLKTDGNGYKAIIAPAGGFRNLNATREDFIWPDGNIRNLYNTIMNGEEVFSFTISDIPKTIKEFMQLTNTNINDYDCIALHQANQFIHKLIAKKLKINIEKIPLSINKYGNTSAPSIPLLICDVFGKMDNHYLLNTLMCGFGVGLSWGVCSTIINTEDIYPVIESDLVYEEGIINNPKDL